MDNFRMPHAPPSRTVLAGPLDQLEQVLANADDTPFVDAFDVVDVSDSELALWQGKQTLAGRLLATDAPVRLTVASGDCIAHVVGNVRAVAPPFLFLDGQAGQLVVSLTTIVVAADLPREGAPNHAFIHAKSALRPFIDRRVSVMTTAKTTVAGVLRAVGEDHIDLLSNNGETLTVQYAAIARMDFAPTR